MLLRYQNGALISAPSSSNQLINQLLRQGGFNGTPINPDNRVAGVNPLAVDPNCGCFNPQTTLVLNPKAWAEPASGQWGTAAPFTNSYRWQRQPAESMSFARNFPFGKEGRFNAQFRLEFQNIFNRLFLSAPATGNQGLASDKRRQPFPRLRRPSTACTPPAMATSIPSAAPGPNRGPDKRSFG